MAAAPATGGTSLAVALVEAGGVGVDAWIAYRALYQYDYDKAAANTDFNPDKSLGTGPSSLGLAMDLMGLGLSAAAASKVLGKYASSLGKGKGLGDVERDALRLELNKLGEEEGVEGVGDVLFPASRGKDSVAEPARRGSKWWKSDSTLETRYEEGQLWVLRFFAMKWRLTR